MLHSTSQPSRCWQHGHNFKLQAAAWLSDYDSDSDSESEASGVAVQVDCIILWCKLETLSQGFGQSQYGLCHRNDLLPLASPEPAARRQGGRTATHACGAQRASLSFHWQVLSSTQACMPAACHWPAAQLLTDFKLKS